VNDNSSPSHSNDKSSGAYGNWYNPNSTQWVQYDWVQDYSISSTEIYWFDDDGGVLVPTRAHIEYWDGDSWIDAGEVPLVEDAYNTLALDNIVTRRLRVSMLNTSQSTGILEWRVYGTPADDGSAGDPVDAGNIAPSATAATSYVSPWETLSAVNDNSIPSHSNDKSSGAYGNWYNPNSIQWVQYDWPQDYSLSSTEIYWFDDDGGVLVPTTAYIDYWDGNSWIGAGEVPLAEDAFNTLALDDIVTSRLRVSMLNTSQSTGILEWRVYGTPSPGPEPGPEPAPQPEPAPEPAPEPGNCAREVTSCTSPMVTVKNINLGIPVMGYGRESDTDPLPMAIAAMPSGGSRLAWLGTDNRVYVAKLDCNDQLVGTPNSFPAIDLQDLYADEKGGVVLLTRNATNGGTDNCGNGTLCGGTSSQCKTMHMVRFDDAGNVEWQQQVTNLSDDLAGYDNGARFVWWYQHHGRLAVDNDDNYAAYFGTAITVNNGSCVDIHQGDRMQVVDSNGSLVSGHPDSFEVGCSHSWQTRMVWDPQTNHFVMVCATDNNCRIAQPNPYRTVVNGDCDGTLFGGDLVLSSTDGYWTAWSQGGQVYLEHFTDSASDATIITGVNSSHPHLVSLGANRMLLAWESGQSMAAQVYDSGTGESVGKEFTIDVKDHNYQAFKAYQDGSVAYPAAGNNNTSIRIARVMPCSD
jgi:hypothetical protein